MTEDLKKLFPNALICEKEMMKVGDGVELAVYKLVPQEADRTKAKETILFIPGFIAVLVQWSRVINSLVRYGFPIYIMETREKSSSTATDKSERFSEEGYMLDLVDILKQLNLPQPFSIVGVSLGAAMAIKHVVNNRDVKLAPEKIVLIDAIYHSSPMNWLISVAKMPKFLFWLAVKFTTFFAPITLLRVKRRDKYTYQKIRTNLKKAAIGKMRVTLQGSEDKTITKDLSEVKVPTLVFGVRGDKMHPIEQSMLIAETVKDGRFIDMADDELMHSEQAAVFIASFLDEVGGPHPYISGKAKEE